MSVIIHETAQALGIKPGQHRVKYIGIDGAEKECATARISLWLRLTRVEALAGAADTNILGFGILREQMWRLPDGTVWSFVSNKKEAGIVKLSLSQTPIPLPPSKITNVRQYPPPAALMGIDGVVTDLEKRGILKRTHSPYNSPVWPVKKRTGQWHFTVDYRQLNANTAPLAAAVPNMTEIVTLIQGTAHPWMAVLAGKVHPGGSRPLFNPAS